MKISFCAPVNPCCVLVSFSQGVTAVAPHAVTERREGAVKAYLAVRQAVVYVTINLPVGVGLTRVLAAVANQITLFAAA